jgi:hypothetical protein
MDRIVSYPALSQKYQSTESVNALSGPILSMITAPINPIVKLELPGTEIIAPLFPVLLDPSGTERFAKLNKLIAQPAATGTAKDVYLTLLFVQTELAGLENHAILLRVNALMVPIGTAFLAN